MKKLVILTPRFPYPVIGGDRLRIYNICKILSEHYELTLLSLCESKNEMSLDVSYDSVFTNIIRVYQPKWKSYLNCLKSLFTGVPLQVSYYFSHQFQLEFDSLESTHDGVLCHLVRTAEYARNSKLPNILEMTDAISMNYERVRAVSKLGGIKNIIYSVEQSRIASYEKVMLEKFDLSVVVSKFDRDYLLANNSQYSDKLLVCSNGVDLSNFKKNYISDQKTIIFIGNMTTVQNIDAAKWFSLNVMPLLNKKGDYRFKIIGKITPKLKDEFNSFTGVIATGGVDNIADASKGAFVGVCPMRLGAGVQNKVLEYMAMGIPSITSSLGLEGLEAFPDKDILVADSEIEFLDAIEKLKSSNIAESISENGRCYVEKHHMWNSKLTPFISKIAELVK